MFLISFKNQIKYLNQILLISLRNKKNQLNSTYRLTSDQKWLLTIINQIILFDLIIYNTIYNSPQYKQNVIDTKKSINEYIEKI